MSIFSSPGNEWWNYLSADEQDEYTELQSYPPEVGEAEARLVQLYLVAHHRMEEQHGH